MPITPTYPGLYIEELPNSTHSIVAAPTSITVFVGYTHPFKTTTFNEAIPISSFTDYEREFGGLYASGVFDSSVAYAVNEFFLNGGSRAYVVGLQANYHDAAGAVLNPTPPVGTSVTVPTTGGGIIFTAQEPTDRVPMRVTISNRKQTVSPNDTADISIAYGSRVETFRSVVLSNIETVIGTVASPVSSMITVSPDAGIYGTAFAADTVTPVGFTPPPTFSSTFSAADFMDVFQQDSSLDKVDIFNLLAIPGVSDNSIWSLALAFCERKLAFGIMDPPRQAAADRFAARVTPTLSLPLIADELPLLPKSINGALYFPYLNTIDPLTASAIELPPSGFVAGVYARIDTNRGVWKAPAGFEATVNNTTGVVARGRLSDTGQGALNPIAINCLRSFPGIGSTVVFGARTLQGADTNTAFQQWKYVPVRRLALFIEQTLLRNLTWAVFEPNDEPLWIAMRTSVENFMLSLFNQHAFQGSKPSQAFQVKCDASTTTQQDIDNGIVNIIVAFAPLKPAEFVIIKIAQLAGQAQT